MVLKLMCVAAFLWNILNAGTEVDVGKDDRIW